MSPNIFVDPDGAMEFDIQTQGNAVAMPWDNHLSSLLPLPAARTAISR
jgi:hypothetical protein